MYRLQTPHFVHFTRIEGGDLLLNADAGILSIMANPPKEQRALAVGDPPEIPQGSTICVVHPRAPGESHAAYYYIVKESPKEVLEKLDAYMTWAKKNAEIESLRERLLREEELTQHVRGRPMKMHPAETFQREREAGLHAAIHPVTGEATQERGAWFPGGGECRIMEPTQAPEIPRITPWSPYSAK